MRQTYIISYDIPKKNQNYEKVYDYLKGFGTWAHITESLWGIKSEKSASEIRDDLVKIAGTEANIFVLRSGVESAWKNVLCSNKWLQDNL
ncbi:hypothetical protein [Leptospira levettii]|uniref:hypothetical protein n=1 Tax=Leptospira levettii TaxID=2023178 RepID=UPI00223D2368|nr:hypothetical protein [Leptospira levettii]MCW7475638.1 hypothetical protein [Leptospira levettii]